MSPLRGLVLVNLAPIPDMSVGRSSNPDDAASPSSHLNVIGRNVEGMKRAQTTAAQPTRKRVSTAIEAAVTDFGTENFSAKLIRDATAMSPVGRYRPVCAKHHNFTALFLLISRP